VFSKSQNFINGSLKPAKHHPTVPRLLASIYSGCYICNRLWARLSNTQQGILSEFASDTSGTSSRSSKSEASSHSSKSEADAEENSSFITSCYLSDGDRCYPALYLFGMVFNALGHLPVGFHTGGNSRTTLILHPSNSKCHKAA
jgi:hypothetical protein